MANGSEQPPQVSQQNLMLLARALVRGGMDTKDVAELFGSSLGVPTGSPNYDELFAQYMPTFVQVNQSEPENSIRRSIAKEVMAGTPVWQITEGIANAIERGDAGITPGSTLEELSRFADTLQREYRSYTEASGKAENKSVFQEYGLPDPNARYTVQEMFPDVMNKLFDLEKQNPTYRMGAVGSGAKLQPRVEGKTVSITKKGDSSALLNLAKNLLNDPEATNFNVGGKSYTRTELRDVVIPDLQQKVSQQEKVDKESMIQIGNLEGIVNNLKSVRDNARMEYFRGLDYFKQGGKYGIDEARLNELKTAADEADKTLNAQATALSAMKRRSGLSRYKEDGQKQMPEYDTSTAGPGGYVGPAAGESTMARTFDPYWNTVAKGVVSGLQEKIDKSGRTPYLDSLNRLALFSKFVKGK